MSQEARMKISSFLALFLFSVTTCINAQNPPDVETAASNQLQGLYKVLHDIALPGSSFDLTIPKRQRLALVLPGKVLSKTDYYPGRLYEESLKGDDPNAKIVDIPLRVQQNMFQLCDVVPGLNPFRGAESGESFSLIYRDVLGSMDIKGFDELSEEKKKRHKRALEVLSEEVEDRDEKGETVKTTRLALYRKYQRLYNEARERMESTIGEKRSNLTRTQYEIWFVGAYPFLQSEVDGAFLDWQVVGNKDIVELERSRLDTSSPAVELLDAKSVLRASGFTSLDRTQTVYPTSFVPGDWYNDLDFKPFPMTREQIQQRIGDLEGQQQLMVLTKLSARNPKCNELQASHSNLTTKAGSLEEALNSSVSELATSHCRCVSAGYRNPNKNKDEIQECQDYKMKLSKALENAHERGVSAAEVKELNSLLGDDNTKGIDAAIDRINVELKDLQAALATAPDKQPDVLDATGEPFDPTDRWFGFAYEYNSSSTTRDDSYYAATYSSASSSYRRSNSYSWWWRTRSSSSSSYRSQRSSSLTQSFSEMTNSNFISVKGKLLRVTCQRPWFRPSLFRNKRYKIVDDRYKVSPGPLPEKDFLSQANNTEVYKIPQYLTSFLLARNVQMEFSGVSKSTASSLMRSANSNYRSSYSRGSSGWGPFTFSSRSDYSSSSSRQSSSSTSFQVSTTASGMKISIPAPQLVGYYTQVVEEFPKKDIDEP